MKTIVLGSFNPVKFNALLETLPEFPFLGAHETIKYDAVSSVSLQPLTLYETMTGAKNRALDSYAKHKDKGDVLAFGVESGLFDIPFGYCTKADICVCCIFDGKSFFLGYSQPFVLPRNVEILVVNNGMDLNGAFHTLRMTDNPKIGHAEGMVSILSGGRITRKDYTMQAIRGALIQLEKPELYSSVTCF